MDGPHLLAVDVSFLRDPAPSAHVADSDAPVASSVFLRVRRVSVQSVWATDLSVTWVIRDGAR